MIETRRTDRPLARHRNPKPPPSVTYIRHRRPNERLVDCRGRLTILYIKFFPRRKNCFLSRVTKRIATWVPITHYQPISKAISASRLRWVLTRNLSKN